MLIFKHIAQLVLDLFRSCSKVFRKAFLKIRNIHRNEPVLESPFNGAAGLQPLALSTKDFSTDVFLRNLQKF